MVETEVRPPIEPRFEDRLLQSELISSRQVTLREILNKKGTDSVGLLDIPANFQVREEGDSRVYIVSFPKDQASFGGERLIQVLGAAKPVKRGMAVKSQNKDGIVADWKMFLWENEGKKYDLYDRLHQQHTDPTSPITRKLKDHFREIEENHFERFWDAIYANPENSVARNLGDTFGRLMSGEKALDRYPFDFIISAYYIFPQAIREDQKFALAEFLKRKGFDIDVTLDSHALFEKTCSLVNNLINPERKDLLIDFYNGLSDTEKRKFIYSATGDYSGYILVDEECNLYSGWLDYLSEIRKIDRNQIEIRDEESYLKVSFVRNEETGFRDQNVLERYVQPEEGELTPVIIWETDKVTGRRKYFCGKISKELIEAFPDMFFPTQDTLFGQIAVAAYSENLKTSLPTKLPLVKGGRKQDMLEAQMLAFPKLFFGAYLKSSPVIRGLEALAHKK